MISSIDQEATAPSHAPRPPKLRTLLHALESILEGQTSGATRVRGIMLCRQIGLAVQDQEIDIDKAAMQRRISSAEKIKLSQVCVLLSNWHVHGHMHTCFPSLVCTVR